MSIDFERLDAIAIASVVPTLTEQVTRILAPSKVPIHMIQHQSPFSFAIITDTPEKTGTDRLVNAECAIREYGYPCMIVDLGTATTICAVSRSVDNRPVFLGGAIMPGLRLSLEALVQNTAQLKSIELVPPLKVIGKNTEQAMQSGILMGHAAMIDGMVRQMKNEMKSPHLPVIATGGLSSHLKNLTQELTHFDTHLTLKGIAYLVP